MNEHDDKPYLQKEAERKDLNAALWFFAIIVFAGLGIALFVFAWMRRSIQ